MPTVAFNICCPRDCVSRHNGGTSGAPLKPLRVDSALRVITTPNWQKVYGHGAECLSTLLFKLNLYYNYNFPIDLAPYAILFDAKKEEKKYQILILIRIFPSITILICFLFSTRHRNVLTCV